ncbi:MULTISPECIES: class I SAM-dependent methyltransferase [Rhodococcus]|jgi:SAM-dependent methyltransferase|uniref:Class I SAM-dependent methyltransferase n=1 Tax=Rhodococcus oxybenzonivorans TaxID=1990687 RepID=A0AAE5A5H1_9NOCA|nr:MULTISPECIES: class I SAM-dependent methyltransferase [Rhodococcus]MDV7242111.1 class I SAM-dependent methyltransferase [Rhodococcus oxybenzonivorans]MDV7264577.1 class I SAM-dependent methyltransferase [Rhodococcus oxybenzonivorans]MDV7276394.1 class I SAM-dependent methyltransferase [Rhodococcus oxybenzonivorans]MDV7331599.1 class I SAM-dependent methyltransferase [Rhodococcus oxybenzonivorans]MDV7343821.1 class I SAM-dependent methyltransferase [Rhodococcus oxybenzonivorans]
MSERTPSQWEELAAADPAHSTWYVERFRTMAAEGKDIFGEARLVDAMLGRGGRVLDAGCGPGRLGGYLHEAGHVVVGVDVDPVLIAAAEEDYPGPTWLVGDLAELDLPGRGVKADFDVIVCAGNVMTFLAPSTREAVLAGFARHLGPAGRVVVGFGADRGYDFSQFLTDAATAGLAVDLRLSTWDLRPFTDESQFLVAVFSRAGA